MFVLHNGSEDEVCLSSDDWVARNLDGSVELIVARAGHSALPQGVDALDAVFRNNVKRRRLGITASGGCRAPTRDRAVRRADVPARTRGPSHGDGAATAFEPAALRRVILPPPVTHGGRPTGCPRGQWSGARSSDLVVARFLRSSSAALPRS